MDMVYNMELNQKRKGEFLGSSEMYQVGASVKTHTVDVFGKKVCMLWRKAVNNPLPFRVGGCSLAAGGEVGSKRGGQAANGHRL
jgi:hypothetical protein